MKIALVLDDGLDTTDGVQQYVLHIGGWLSAQGHEVHYLVGQTTRTDLPNVHSMSRNIHVRFNGNRMSIPLPASRRRLKQFLDEYAFDVLHVQAVYSPFMAGRLIRAASSDIAVVGTFHILPYSRFVLFANRLLAVLNRKSGKRFDKMLAVSIPAKAFAKQLFGYEADVVPNPIDVARFDVQSNSSKDLKIVFLGRLVERKGAQHLLQAVAYLKKHELTSVPFSVIIGGKGELLGKLQEFVRQNGLEDSVSFAGFVEEANKPDFLAQADIAVYPSTGGESFGIVLLEAMAAARGVVLAGNNPGYSSVMSPYPDQLFDPIDIRSFAERLAWYLEHELARARANELQHQYVQRFDTKLVGQELLRVYEHALQVRRQS
jgi:phosphatidylinositol alpha-mannosyltransferase